MTSRYCLVLEELRLETMRQTRQQQFEGTDFSHTASEPNVLYAGGPQDSQQHQLPGVENNMVAGLPLQLDPTADLGEFHVSPSDSIADLTSWGQFDSMVSSRCPCRRSAPLTCCQVISGFNQLDSFLGNPSDKVYPSQTMI